MANQFLKLRRSSVPGKIPDTGSLDFGEIALNTHDGLAFMKKSSSLGEEVIIIGSTQGAFTGSFSGSFTGSLFGTASWAYNALTASTADDFVVRGTLTGSNAIFTGTVTAQTLVAQTISSSVIYSSGSNIFGDELIDKQTFTGSVDITGSLTLFGLASLSGSFSGSFFGNGAGLNNIPASGIVGLNLSRIATGSITASVDTDPSSVFLIKSESVSFFNISSSGNTTLSSNLFIVKNFTTDQPVLTVSQSVVKIATQSFDPTGTTDAGSIWFTNTAMYVGLE